MLRPQPLHLTRTAHSAYNIRMSTKKKKTLVLLAIVLLLLGIYAYRNYIAPQADAAEVMQAQAGIAEAPEAEAGLTLVDEYAAGGTAAGEAGDSLIVPSDDPWPMPEEESSPSAHDETPEAPAIDEDGAYTSRDDVALYLYTYGRLPDNFITKKQAEALGWEGGGLDDYAYGKCIGGSHYGNYEGLLPEKKGRRYTECDIDTMHRSSRGSKRIVFSNDGLIYYTGDHYESFTLLYGEE